ncbi:MAG: TRAP transporter large permease [Hydrogenophaga sp.]|uniref:TRAP transporter large permease protein n=1 Tax=Hydrogenophaga crocea TaxID=2716225 RepID=A0A6G8ICD6_9BURK|nr:MULTISPECIES: TRAP transporter large permease [Hydrogenophaga]MBL0945165.1 TRAP transporter large permease [Hydrogenophaga sp.]QIM50854.1 TRAP transporter large permease [Hydrogenophaga crocea]
MTTVLGLVFLALMVLGAPIAFAMLIAGLVAVWLKPGLSELVVMQNLFSGLDSFPLMAIPFFILAAELMTGGALTDVLLRFAARLVGMRRGGLGHANILTLTFFSGISGSALADAAGPGAMLIKMMRKAGYQDAYAAALTASTAIVGPIIPPSIIMIVYALTDTSVTITGLFLAGVVPGFLIALSLMVVNHWISVKRDYRSSPDLIDPAPLLRLFWRALPALMLPVIILGGIHLGIFTPTEASAAAVLYALIVGRYVYGTLRWSMLPDILFRSALMTASILFIVATSAVFAWVLTVGQIPQQMAAWIAGMQLSPIELLIAINVLLLLVGIFIEPLPGVMIMVPILAPLAEAAGLNPLHFAIVVIVNLTLGMVTPPVGGLLFVTSAVSGVRMGPMVREMAPMLAALFTVLALLTFVPAFSTWLPNLLGYAH